MAVVELRRRQYEHRNGGLNFQAIFPDALRIICSFLNGFDILALQMTCSMGFKAKLNPLVTEFRIPVWTTAPASFYPFGCLIGELRHLITVDIFVDDAMAWQMGVHLLTMLPKSLETLKLSLSRVLGDFLLGVPNPAVKGVMRETSPSIRHQGVIVSAKNLRDDAVKRFFREIPDSLCYIELAETPLVKWLPTSLTPLKVVVAEVPGVYISQEGWHNLIPAQVTNLRATETTFSEAKFFQLPQGLQRFNWYGMTLTPFQFDLYGFKQMTKLTMTVKQRKNDAGPGLVNQELFGLLPRSLTCFRFYGSDNWPLQWSMLPKGLKTLEIALKDQFSVFDFHLPPTLTSLCFDFFILSKTDVAAFPASLTRYKGHLEATNTATTEITHFVFPDALSDLTITGSGLQDDFIADLPPHLTSFTFRTGQPVKTLISLPFSLTSLNFDGCPFLSPSALHHLPQDLKSLRFTMAWGCNDALIKSLPSSLTSLIMPVVTSLTDSSVPLLPRSLTRLEAPQLASLTHRCFPSLPRNLSVLILRKVVVEPVLDPQSQWPFLEDIISTLPPFIIASSLAWELKVGQKRTPLSLVP